LSSIIRLDALVAAPRMGDVGHVAHIVRTPSQPPVRHPQDEPVQQHDRGRGKAGEGWLILVSLLDRDRNRKFVPVQPKGRFGMGDEVRRPTLRRPPVRCWPSSSRCQAVSKKPQWKCDEA
jgi:hypothetical protein